jgi:hypothetical protein
VAKEEGSIGKAVKKYRKMSSDNPEAKLALDVAPFSGVATSLADAGADAYEGNYVDAGLDLLGVVPGVKLIKGMGAIKSSSKYAGPKADLARTTDRASDSVTYAEEKAAEAKEPTKRNVFRSNANPKLAKKMKTGGMTASSRGDGIASRGKTKGRFV